MIVPYEAEFDPESGNLIMTMKFDGLLVRTTNSEYHWVPVHNYEHEEISLGMIIGLLIPGDIALALFFGTVSAGTFNWKESKWVWKLFLFLLFAGSMATGIIIPPAISFVHYGVMPILIAVIVGGVVAFSMYNSQLLNADHPLFLMVTGLVVNVLYLAPFIFWGFNIIPKYHIAFGIGVGLSAGWTVLRHFQYAKIKKAVAEEEI